MSDNQIPNDQLPSDQIPSDQLLDDETPLWDTNEMNEPDLEEDQGERGAVLRLEGVTVPADLIEYGNGTLPDSALQLIGVGHQRLHPIAAAGFAQLRAAAKSASIDLTCTDAYRNLATQIELKRIKPDFAATPGRSVHGWGFAVDVAVGPELKAMGWRSFQWIVDNGPSNGWFQSRPTDEPWHWVYRGVSRTADKPTTQVPTSTGKPTLVTPATTPGPSDALAVDNAEVGLGSSGRSVIILTGLLGLTPRETFDAETDTAVRNFQGANALGIDGKVGRFTWTKMRQVTAPVERPELRLGATGAAVTWLQRRLGSVAAESFSADLELLVKGFQRERNLSDDGRVGPKTWVELTS